MGLGRFLWRATGIGHRIETVKNILDEGSIVKGVKKTVKEDFCEDNPVTAHIYDVGKFDGKKDGYAQASEEYKAKLLEQADYAVPAYSWLQDASYTKMLFHSEGLWNAANSIQPLR